MFYFTNEIVFAGHPDKVCDQISDALLDAYMKYDKFTRAGIEVVGGKGKIFITGEVTSNTDVDVEAVVKKVLKTRGYNENKYEIINNLGKQSNDIARGVDAGGAGDQGMMWGFACNDTKRYLRTAQCILQDFAALYEQARIVNKDLYSDGKAQITARYDDDWKLLEIKDFVISYQNAEEDRENTDNLVMKLALNVCKKYNVKVKNMNIIINPTGKFEKGGFDADAGLTGRKIVVDSYQGFCHVGGGAFSGKDPSKVDRSAAYKARQLAIRYLKDFNLKWCEVQLSYAIGMDKPMAIYINSDKGKIKAKPELYDECTPKRIIEDLDLYCTKFEQTAMFGHFTGRNKWEM